MAKEVISGKTKMTDGMSSVLSKMESSMLRIAAATEKADESLKSYNKTVNNINQAKGKVNAANKVSAADKSNANPIAQSKIKSLQTRAKHQRITDLKYAKYRLDTNLRDSKLERISATRDYTDSVMMKGALERGATPLAKPDKVTKWENPDRKQSTIAPPPIPKHATSESRGVFNNIDYMNKQSAKSPEASAKWIKDQQASRANYAKSVLENDRLSIIREGKQIYKDVGFMEQLKIHAPTHRDKSKFMSGPEIAPAYVKPTRFQSFRKRASVIGKNLGDKVKSGANRGYEAATRSGKGGWGDRIKNSMTGPISPLHAILYKLLGSIKDLIAAFGQKIRERADADKKMKQRMYQDPELFGIAANDDNGRDAWLDNRYEKAKEHSNGGLDGAAIMEDAMTKAFVLGVGDNGAFKNYNEVEQFALGSAALKQNSGANDREAEVMDYQLLQIMGKGYADIMDIKPLMQSAPTMMKALREQMGMTISEVMNAGRTRELTGEKMKDAIIAIADKNVAMANQERMQTSGTQTKAGVGFINASMRSWSKAFDEALVKNQAIFVFFRMLGQVASSLGTVLFGTSLKADTLRGSATEMFLGIFAAIRGLVLVGMEIGNVAIGIHDMAGSIITVYTDMVANILLVMVMMGTGMVMLLQEYAIQLLTLWPNLLAGLLGLVADAIKSILGEDSRLASIFTDGASSVSKATEYIKTGIRSNPVYDMASRHFDAAKSQIGANFDSMGKSLNDTGVGFLDRRNAINGQMDVFAGQALEDKKTMETINEDTAKSNPVNTDPKVEAELKGINRNTKKTADDGGDNLEILREIAGYQVINQVTRVRPNHIYNFGDIRSEGIPMDQIVNKLASSVKAGQSKLNNTGTQTNATIVTRGVG